MLHSAIRAPHSEEDRIAIIDCLFSNGTDSHRLLTMESNRGRVPLHVAALKEGDQILEHLLKFGGPIDPTDELGSTPLILATRCGFERKVEMLLHHGANVRAVAEGKTVLEIAESTSCPPSIVTMLKQRILTQLDTEFWGAERDTWRKENRVWNAVGEQAFANGSRSPVEFTDIHDDDIEGLKAALSRVLAGTYDVGTETFFETLLDEEGNARFPTAYLFNALTYASSDSCSAHDVSSLLDRYDHEIELSLESGSTVEVHPLYFLVHARLARLQSNPSREASFLAYFSSQFGDHYGGALTPEESCAIDPAILIARKKSKPPKEQSASNTVESQWRELRSRLSKAQQEPMDRLLELEGLTKVKQLALSIYTDILADTKLRDKGYEHSVASRALNFTFVGNPGTGKTTVAELFADLLSAAGARPGHRFVSMKAQEALRKGSKGFAKELSSLTGTTGGVGPSDLLLKGSRVEVLFKEKSGEKWYPATILAIQPPVPGVVDKKTFTVKTDNNLEDASVDDSRIRRIKLNDSSSGGVLFLDEAYNLKPATNPEGRAIFNEIMSVSETHRKTVAIILAGYKDDIEKELFSFNIGLRSRFTEVKFDDFSQDQLCRIWEKQCKPPGKGTAWQCEPKVSEAAARRVARGIGRKGFGNARDVRKLFENAVSTAKVRFLNNTSDGAVPEIRMTDVIGEAPSRETNLELDSALTELEEMIGLGKIKSSINGLVEMAKINYEQEKELCSPDKVTSVVLNRCFLGNPGTGKTTVAKIYGRVLKALNLLSSGEVVYKTASDFMGSAVGQSQEKTRDLLELSEGKVLLIDEAYVLDDNLYGKQVLNTIVEQVTGKPGEDIAVVMAGYKPEMLKMFREQNPGLSRRFNLSNAFEFDDFNNSELFKLVSLTLKNLGVLASVPVRKFAVSKLAKLRELPNFGNAGEVNTMLNEAKRHMEQRCRAEERSKKRLKIIDLGSDKKNAKDPMEELEDLYGMEKLKERLRSIRGLIKVKQLEGRPQTGLFSHAVFTGSPGTGKTMVAKLMGKVLHLYGILARDHVEITSGEDMVAGFVGQTKDKVQKLMEAARGGILFIDEAYSLKPTRSGSFKEETIHKLLSMLTEDQYEGTIVVIAGYFDDMQDLLAANAGLKSRFLDFVSFPDWDPDSCVGFTLKSLSLTVPTPYEFGVDEDEHSEIKSELHRSFAELSERDGWANARDAKRMIQEIENQRDHRLSSTYGDGIVESPRIIRLEDVRRACKVFEDSRPRKSGEVKTTPYPDDLTSPPPAAADGTDDSSGSAVRQNMRRVVNIKKEEDPIEGEVKVAEDAPTFDEEEMNFVGALGAAFRQLDWGLRAMIDALAEDELPEELHRVLMSSYPHSDKARALFHSVKNQLMERLKEDLEEMKREEEEQSRRDAVGKEHLRRLKDLAEKIKRAKEEAERKRLEEERRRLQEKRRLQEEERRRRDEERRRNSRCPSGMHAWGENCNYAN